MAFYRIKEAAEKIGVLPHVLRFWETQFPSMRPSKTSRGQRLYNDEDLEAFLKIKHLLYTEGYSISGAKKFLKEQKSHSKVENAVVSDVMRELAQDVRNLRDFIRDYSSSF